MKEMGRGSLGHLLLYMGLRAVLQVISPSISGRQNSVNLWQKVNIVVVTSVKFLDFIPCSTGLNCPTLWPHVSICEDMSLLLRGLRHQILVPLYAAIAMV